MKTRILAPILVASLGLGVLAACSSDSTSEVVTPTSVQLPDVTTSSAAPVPSTSIVPVTTIPSTTIPATTLPVTTSAPVSPSTTAPKRQVATTVPAAPKTNTPAVTGTPSEILDKLRADVLAFERKVFASGNFDLYGNIGPLQRKYAGAATLTYKHDTVEGYSLRYYTGTSGDLTRVWDYAVGHYGDIILVDR